VIGGGRTRDVSQQKVLDRATAERQDRTTTTTTTMTSAPEEQCINKDQFRTLDGSDDDDNDVFVDAVTNDACPALASVVPVTNDVVTNNTLAVVEWSAFN